MTLFSNTCPKNNAADWQPNFCNNESPARDALQAKVKEMIQLIPNGELNPMKAPFFICRKHLTVHLLLTAVQANQHRP